MWFAQKAGCHENVTIRMNQTRTNSLLIYQDEDENQGFPLFLCVLKQTCDERTNNYMQCNTLGAWFVRHRHNIEQTKTFVFGFIFAFLLAHKQAISR